MCSRVGAKGTGRHFLHLLVQSRLNRNVGLSKFNIKQRSQVVNHIWRRQMMEAPRDLNAPRLLFVRRSNRCRSRRFPEDCSTGPRSFLAEND